MTTTTLAPVATAKNSFALKMVNQLTARLAEVDSHDTVIALEYFGSYQVAIDAAMNRSEFKELAKRLLVAARLSDNKSDKTNYIAVKVLVKVAKTLCAIGQNSAAMLDAHTLTLGKQLVKLSNLTAKSGLVCQSKGAIYSEFDKVQELDYKATRNYALSTAGTQLSSSRMLFNYLGMCDVIKFKKDDTLTIQDNERARAFIALCA